jgi:ribitol-5-phosphate 2-dehydrogenase (NADP+) / D-ribitol-5-phosphate cytidylyltransferase
MAEKENIVVILSGGAGTRFNNSKPKQFAEVYGKAVLDYCISNFNKHQLIHKILIVSNPEYIDYSKHVARVGKFNKLVDVIFGGKTRGESSYNGLKYINEKFPNQDFNVLIQDGVRPNTSLEIIDNILFKLKDNDAVSVVIPATDTIYVTNNSNELVDIPDRKYLFRAQTPQAFNFKLIFDAYSNLNEDFRYSFTDDCSLLRHVFPNQEIKLVEGDVSNLKITFNEDLESFRQLLKQKR